MSKQTKYQDFDDELDVGMFEDFEFDIESSSQDETKPDGHVYASAPIYVRSIGRGKRKMPNPLNIPLPWQYYEEMEGKKRAAASKSSEASRPPTTASSHPGLTRDHRTVKAPLRLEVPSRPPTKPKMRGRGRGKVLEDGLMAIEQRKIPIMQIKDLGRARLPNGDSEGGKARLMQMFLDQESYFDKDNSSDSSAHSAPAYNLKNKMDFPNLIKSIPFKWKSGSLDENLKGGGRRAVRIGDVGSLSSGLAASNRDDRASSVSNREEKASSSSNNMLVDHASSCGDTGERSGNRSSGGEDVLSDFIEGERGACGVNTRDGDGAQVNGATSSHNRSSSNSQVMEGPNVLELMNLPPNLTKENLGDLLMGCGNIIEMRILCDPDTEQCIGLAYVRMADEDACLMAVNCYNDTESPFHEMYGEKDVPNLMVRYQKS